MAETLEEYERRMLDKAIDLLRQWRSYGQDKYNEPKPFEKTCTFLDSIYLGKGE